MRSALHHAAPDPTRALVVRSAMAVALEVPALLLAQEPGLVGRFGLILALIAVVSPRFGRGPVPAPLVAGFIHLMGLLASLGVFMLIEPVRPSFGRLLCLGCLGIAVPRLWLGGTKGSRTLVLGFGLMALMGLARATDKLTFGLAVGLYLVAGLLATLRADQIWPRLLKHKLGLGLPMLLTLTAAGGLMTALAWALPAAEPAVSRALAPWLQGKEAKSGFGFNSIRLGKLAQINTSDRLVLRVHGQTDYLRGQVYLDYSWGHWNRRAQTVEERLPDAGTFIFNTQKPGRTIRIEAEPDAALALFAPLDTVRVDDVPDGVKADQYGIVRVPQSLHSEPLIWRIGVAGNTPPTHVAAPTERDLALVERVRPEWEQLAQQWTTPERAPQAKIADFISRFRRDFRYSLELPQVPHRVDPVLYFATTARYGHCEYFASALIMLARSQGIPARMATGYRVFEQSGNGWAIVRDRDAHAWAEVWIDGRWQTVEPTPPGSLAGENLPVPGWFATQWDAFKRWLRRTAEWLGDLTARELVPVGAMIIALVGVLIWLRRRKPTPQPQTQSGFAPLEVLENALSDKGVQRAPHQTLRQFAQVVRQAGHGDAADLIEQCARWIYAERGDPIALEKAVHRWAE